MQPFIQKGLSIVLFLLCVNCAFAQDLWDGTIAKNFYCGSGTELDPYQICTGSELMYFVEQVNQGQSFYGKNIKLMNDIDMNGKCFHTTRPFEGTFNGGGHILTVCFSPKYNGPLFNIPIDKVNALFTKIGGKIHHLGIIGTLGEEDFSAMSLTDTLAATGVIENCFSHCSSISMLGKKSFMAKCNYGIIKNCYAQTDFHDHYYSGDPMSLVFFNMKTGLIENCYFHRTGGLGVAVCVYQNYEGAQQIDCYYSQEGLRRAEYIDKLNEWVDNHPGYSRWSLTENYALVYFNAGPTCSVEFIDRLFGNSFALRQLSNGDAVGELPVPSADCTFVGWQHSGKIISPSDIVESNLTLFAKWDQQIRKQPTEEDMSMEVDDAAHATFQWYAIYGSKQTFDDWQSTNHGRDSKSSNAITFEAKAGQVFMFSYAVSCQEVYDYFELYCNAKNLTTISGVKSGDFSYVFTEDGTYQMLFQYEKDDETSMGLDMVKITNIRLSDPENILSCTDSELPKKLISQDGLYYCKISYSNTGAVLISDTIQCKKVETAEIPDERSYMELTNTVACQGGQSTLGIAMNNVEKITAMQFELSLPEGVSVASAVLTDRKNDHSIGYSQKGNGTYQFTVFSGASKAFSGNEGVVANISLSISNSVAAGSYTIQLKNIELTTTAGDAIKPSDQSATLTVSNIKQGDVNGDDKITITDAVGIVNYILGHASSNFHPEAADLNGDNNISITDAVRVVNIILNQSAGVKERRRTLETETEREPQ